jgi:uncharacterized protein
VATAPQTNAQGQQPAVRHVVRIRGYHTFERKGSWFVYDLEANRFFQVARVLVEVLHRVTAGACEDSIVEELGPTFGERTVLIALHELRQARVHGLFPDWYISKVYNPEDADRWMNIDTGGVQINLAQKCNLACKYCYLGQNEALAGGLMKADVGRQCVDFAFARARRGRTRSVRINFFGGEPLLNKPLLRSLVDYAEAQAKTDGMNVTYTMTTNGTLLDNDTTAFLQKYRFGILVSVDGGPDVQNVMRPFVGGKGSFDVVSKNVRRFRRIRKRLSARVTLSRGSKSKLSIVEALEAMGFTKIGFGVAKGTVEGKTEWDLTDEQLKGFEKEEETLADRFFDQIKKGARPAYNPYDEMMDMIMNPSEKRIRCGVGRGMTTITEEGKMYPCHRYVGMKNWEIGSLQDGLDREKLHSYYAAYVETKRKCQGCWAQRLCGGVCPWYVSKADGTMRPPGAKVCDGIRKGFEDAAGILERVRGEMPEYYEKLVAQYSEAKENRTDPVEV